MAERRQIDKDADERTTPLGLFNTAESYWRAAAALDKAKLKTSHPESPVRFLYYHAIELYLKALLRLHGHTVAELSSRKFGHRTCCLRERAIELGLSFAEQDDQVFSLMACTDAIIRSRYIATGSHRWPTIEALEALCRNIRSPIAEAIRSAGIFVRLAS